MAISFVGWDQLALDLGARGDERGWLHVSMHGCAFTLLRTPLGSQTLVVAYTVLGDEGALSPTEAALRSAEWPVGALALHQGEWLLRHAFVGVPRAEEAIDILRCLAIQAKRLRRDPVALPLPMLPYYID